MHYLNNIRKPYYFIFQNPLGFAALSASFMALISSGDMLSSLYCNFGASSGRLPLGYIMILPYECLFTPKLMVSFSKS
jgi:hypothetical protein